MKTLTHGWLMIAAGACLFASPALLAATDIEVQVSGLSASTVTIGSREPSTYEDQYLMVSNGDDALEIENNGTETLSTGLEVGESYEIAITNQPYLGSQVCSIAEADESGVIDAESGDTITIAVSCSEVTLTIGGTVSGLGTDLNSWEKVTLINNAGEEIKVENGSFTFSKSEYWQGGAYSVTVASNPFEKTCTVDNWYGVANDNVSDIQVTCEDAGEPSPEICVSSSNELQDALSLAAQDGIDNVVKIQSGTYTGAFRYSSTQTNSLTLQGGYADDCVIRDSSPDATVFDGEQVRRPLNLRSSGDVTVQRFTFRDGFQRDHTLDDDLDQYRPHLSGSGGALRATVFSGGGFRLETNVFEDNVGETDGGAAFIFVTSGNLDIVNNLFLNNLAGPRSPIRIQLEGGGDSKFGPSGGAIWLNVNDGKADLIQNTLVDNYAKTGLGGGIRVSMNADGQESYSRLYNNLFFDNKTSGPGYPEEEGNDIWMQYDVGSDFTPEQPPVLVNNRFDDRDPEGIFTDFQFDVNLAVDPGFVDPDGKDFRLAPDSALVDAGLPPVEGSGAELGAFRMARGGSGPSKPQAQASLPNDVVLPDVDLNGEPRIKGASVDVGAYETQAESSPAEPELSASAIEFDTSIVADTSATQSLTVTNTGTRSLSFGNLSITGANGDDFEIVSDECSAQTLSAGETCTVEIEATASAAGTRQAVLNIPTNAGTETATLSLEASPPLPVPAIGPAWLALLAGLLGWLSYRRMEARARVS